MTQDATPQTPETTPPSTPGFRLMGFDFRYWMLCVIEMWERLAYFGVRAVVAIYIMQADEPGGLHFTAAQKGSIYAWWAAFQSILPMVTGGFADRYGYKKQIFVSVTMNIIGFVMMAYMRSYWGFFIGVMVLATGTSLFKPALQGSLAQNLSKKNSSLGWGIFYWIVNVGAAGAPILHGAIRTNVGWKWVFLASAGITALNYLMLLTFKDVQSGADKTGNPLQVFARTMANIFEPRLIAWLLIMSCFWLIMYQVWDLHPNFITDWIDSSSIAAMFHIPASWTLQTDRGVQVTQEIMITLNPVLILVLMIPVSWVVRKMRTLSAMAIGMIIATTGVFVTGSTMSGWVFLGGIVFFSLGEMLTGPKKNEYLGLIAPPGKKAMYLGYVNIPVGVGVFAGSYLAGFLYGNYGEKAVLAQKYLVQHTEHGAGLTWDGHAGSLTELLGVERTEAMQVLQDTLGVDGAAATELLWNTYHPHWHVWLPFIGIGIFATVALVVYGQLAKRWSDMDA